VHGQQLLLSWSITQGHGGLFLALGAHGQFQGLQEAGEVVAKAFLLRALTGDIFFKILFMFLRQSLSWRSVSKGEGEAGSPLSMEPHAELRLRTLRSYPEPKTYTSPIEPTSHPLTGDFNLDRS